MSSFYRRGIAGGLLFFMVLGGIYCCMAVLPRWRLKQRYEEIEIGMSRANVEEILGPPADHLTRFEPLRGLYDVKMHFNFDPPPSDSWWFDDGFIYVDYGS